MDLTGSRKTYKLIGFLATKLITRAIIPSVDHGGPASSVMKSSILQRCARATGAIRSLDTAGVAKMSRRRSADKHIPISIALPRSVVARLDQVLAYKDSRSAYIAAAITDRMNNLEASSVAEAPSRQLMAALSSREDVDSTLRHLLLPILYQKFEL